MAAISNQPDQQGFWERIGFTWDGIAEHRPVSGLTVWLLKLAAISSALVLFFAAVIIGISVTDPTAIDPQSGVMHFANMAMSFGVDGALPGLFFTAVESWQQERRGRSTWLFTLVFFMLTTAFVGYCVSGQSYEPNFAHPLLVAKCMVAILYVMSVAHQVKQNGLNPTQVATLEQRLTTQIEKITDAFQTPPPLDYAEMTRNLLPLVAQEIRQAIPDTTGLVEQVQQLRATVEELATKSAPEIAPESTLSSEDVSDVSAPESDTETLTDARQEERDQERTNITLMSDRRSTQPRTTKRTGTRSEKASKAASIIKRNPQISAPDLAKKANISTSYARKLLVNQ